MKQWQGIAKRLENVKINRIGSPFLPPCPVDEGYVFWLLCCDEKLAKQFFSFSDVVFYEVAMDSSFPLRSEVSAISRGVERHWCLIIAGNFESVYSSAQAVYLVCENVYSLYLVQVEMILVPGKNVWRVAEKNVDAPGNNTIIRVCVNELHKHAEFVRTTKALSCGVAWNKNKFGAKISQTTLRIHSPTRSLGLE